MRSSDRAPGRVDRWTLRALAPGLASLAVAPEGRWLILGPALPPLPSHRAALLLPGALDERSLTGLAAFDAAVVLAPGASARRAGTGGEQDREVLYERLAFALAWLAPGAPLVAVGARGELTAAVGRLGARAEVLGAPRRSGALGLLGLGGLVVRRGRHG